MEDLALVYDQRMHEQAINLITAAASCVETVGCVMIARRFHQTW
jgi:hypothetical protein